MRILVVAAAAKSLRTSQLVIDELVARGANVDRMDLSPLEACATTPMHAPCSCIHAHDVLPRWLAARAAIVITPVLWYQAPSSIARMFAELARSSRLAGRSAALIVHGATGANVLCRSIEQRMGALGIASAGALALGDRNQDPEVRALAGSVFEILREPPPRPAAVIQSMAEGK